jgi:hypothetical protein
MIQKQKNIQKLLLKPEVIAKIKGDNTLFAKVADSLGVTSLYLPYVLRTNSNRLTELAVLRILKDHLCIADENDLLVEVKRKPAKAKVA